jgi:hypothetical protein
MTESDIFKEVAGTMLEESIEVTIDIEPSNAFHAFLIKKGILPSKRIFNVKPMCLGARELISKEQASIPSFSEGDDVMEVNNALSANYTGAIVNTIAIALLNSSEKPNKSLVRFIRRSVNPSDQMRLFLVVRKQLDVRNFLSSTALMRGASLLKPMEIIAAVKPSTTSPSTIGQSLEV